MHSPRPVYHRSHLKIPNWQVTVAQSRLNFMSEFNGSTLILGTHFALPTAGHLIVVGNITGW